MTRLFALIAAGALIGACSGDDGSADGDSAEVTPVVSIADDDRPVDPVPDTSAVTTTTFAPVDRSVAISAVSDELGLDAEVESSALATGDPFGDFAACSGLRDTVSSYAVGVGAVEGSIRWVSINSAARIAGPGIVDADVRIELDSGDAIEGVGTLTLGADLASGSYVAFDAEGRRIEGRFECAGGVSPPATLDGDEVGVVEVVALLGQGRADRVVGLATVDPAAVSCPAGRDDNPLVVRVDGDQSVGGITTFEIAADAAGDLTMRLRVGAVAYEFTDVQVDLLDDGTSGSFSADDGTTTVDGAFTCT